MKELFATEKLLGLLICCSSFFLLGGTTQTDAQTKDLPGKHEAAAIAAEAGAGWSTFAAADAVAFLEITAAEITK